VIIKSGGMTFDAEYEGEYLTSLSFAEDSLNEDAPANSPLKRWLDEYLDGKQPSIDALPLKPKGSEFQQRVWNALRDIPYGHTTTYGEIAQKLCIPCPRAIGGAVGKNPIAIILPCHRVIGANGALTGYAGGMSRKIRLLTAEGHRIENGKVIK